MMIKGAPMCGGALFVCAGRGVGRRACFLFLIMRIKIANPFFF